MHNHGKVYNAKSQLNGQPYKPYRQSDESSDFRQCLASLKHQLFTLAFPLFHALTI